MQPIVMRDAYRITQEKWRDALFKHDVVAREELGILHDHVSNESSGSRPSFTRSLTIG